MTLAEFRLRYPEFGPAEDSWITAVLAEAEYLVSESWGDERDEILGLQAAVLLARSPRGRAAQLNSKDGSSTYSRDLAARKRRHACAFMRIG